MNTNKLISVIVPTYKSKNLEECLDSILQQTYKNIEIIIVDDYSNDSTLDIIKLYAEKNKNIRYILNNFNQGVGASRNKGISIAQGDFIAFLDHDDLWEHSKIELQIEYLNKHPGAGAVYCYCRFLNSDNNINRYISHNTLEDLLLHGAVFCMPGSMIIKTEIIKHAGMFPEEREISEDLALWLDISTITNFLCLPMPLYIRRKHSDQLSFQRNKSCDKMAVCRFFNRHAIDSALRLRAEHALLVRLAYYYRTEKKLIFSCYTFFMAWLKLPSETDPLKSILINLLRWKAVTRTAQKWINAPKS